MALVSKNIPNLINGVSQQPAALRLESQGEVQENGFSDVVDGLKKRPPTKFIRKLIKVTSDYDPTSGRLYLDNTITKEELSEAELSTAFFHTYKRSDETQFQVIITSDKTIYVYDIEGRLRYQSNKGSWNATGFPIAANSDNTDYLPTLNNQITATSVADATFIVNKYKEVAMSDEVFPSSDVHSALVYLKSINYGREYTVTITPKEDVDSAFTVTSGTPNQINNIAVGDESNTEALRVSDVIGKTPSGSSRTNLRSQIIDELGTSVATGSTSAMSTSWSPQSGSVPASFLEIDFPEDGNGTAYDVAAWVASSSDDQIFIQISGTHLNYDSSGEQGWKLNDASTKILLPEYVVRLETKTINIRVNHYRRVRDIVSTTVYDNSNLSGSSVKGIVEPNAYSNEPYFIITTSDAGDIKDFDIIATDDDGGVNLKVFKETAKSFTDLPNQCQHGFRLGVVGDNQKKEDDFHVVFEGSAGSGYWKETVGYNQYNYFDLTTMPHTLRELDDGSFTFGQAQDNNSDTWWHRRAGDDNTNPAPSFVGQKITDIFFHRNRLGVLAGENVIFSEAGSYLNFWRTTVRTLLDSDPIDVSVSQNEVADLKAAIPIQDNLLLFSDLNQFTLSATQLLTPAEVTIDQSTKYECDLTANPVGAGTSVFFATKSGDYAGVREFFTKTDTDIKDAPEITSHVPKYIKGGIRDIKASSNEDILIALTNGETGEKNECYIYKWYNSSEERLQSSWSKWVFDENIASVYFNNADLYFTFEDGSYEKMELTQVSNPVFLDHQVGITNFGEGYAPPNGIAISQEGYNLGAYSDNNETLMNYLDGVKSITVGVPYTFKYQMSEQVFKPSQGDSTKMARFQLRKMSFNFSNTGKFDVTVDSIGRDPSVATFTGRILGEPDNILGQAAIVPEGSFSVGVQSKPTTTKITITNDTHLPSVFQSAEWEGFVTLRNQRL